MIDKEAIAKAVREYNAAENSLRRACVELSAAIPEGFVALHKRPDDKSDHPIYWSYWHSIAGIMESAGREDKYEGIQIIIIEAPPRRQEFLPRLEEPPP